jgi:exopolyphosphatase / guanosine-5'-triphosphate,3'-diphosphate pyrophosphatase
MAHVAPTQFGARPGARGPGAAPCFAALDLGSNNCRLLVARADGANGAGFTVIDSFSRVIRLGEGLGNRTCSGTDAALAPAAMERALAALGICKDKLRRHPVVAVRAVATDACRRAANRDAFLARVKRETGLTLEIISAGEEASLALAGCAPLLAMGPPYALVFDVGGGSSELMWVEARGGHPHLIDFVSLPVGVVGLAESLGSGADRFEDMVAVASEKLGAFEAKNGIRDRAAAGEVGLVGTSGTVTTVAALHLGLAAYDRSKVDGLEMSVDEIDAVTERVLATPTEALAQDPRIGRTRANFVLPGIAILEAVLRAWPVKRVRVADRGVREGILYQLIAVASAALQSGLMP